MIQFLAQTIREHLLTPKRLIVPQRRIGDQWVRQVVRGGQGVVQLWVTPLKTLAVELAERRMSAENVTLIGPRGQDCIITKIVRSMRRNKANRYLAGLTDAPGLFERMTQTINDLRLADVAPTQFTKEAFVNPQKGKELAELLAHYIHELKINHWIDEAQLYQWAVEGILDEPHHFGDTLFLMPEPSFAFGLAQRLLDQIPLDRRISLLSDEPGLLLPDEPATDLQRLRFLDQPDKAPPRLGNNSVRFVRALGEANEVRQVLRTCLAEAIALDEVEILITDRDTYVPLLYETISELQSRDDELTHFGAESWINFADGLPTTFARPGAALAAWVQWVEDDYAQAKLAAMLADGMFALDALLGEGVYAEPLAILLRQLPIGWGRERYRSQIEQAITQSREERGPRTQQLQHLLSFCVRLIELLPAQEPTASEWLNGADRFLELWAAGDNALDNYARQKLRAEVADQHLWLEASGLLHEYDARSWLAALPARTWVDQQGPMPGMLHAATWDRGGHSGRPYTFILGMDEKRMCFASSQDPLLLDAERQLLSPELRTANHAFSDKRSRWHRLLASLRGQVCLSFNGYDLASDQELSPSPLFLASMRLVAAANTSEADQFVHASWIANGSAACLWPQERWWQRLPVGSSLKNPDSMFKHLGALLHAGLLAERARQSSAFTEFDGYVAEVGRAFAKDTQSKPIFSAWSLEMLGRCPLAYFYSKCLELRAVDVLTKEPSQWLPSYRAGTLLHRVFQEFFILLRHRKEKPNRQHHWPILLDLLHDWMETLSKEHPVTSQVAKANQIRDFETAARLFLIEESELADSHEVLYLESNIGLQYAQPGRELDSLEPVAWSLDEQRSIHLGGCIDRIDRLKNKTTAEYVVWDYKTGGSSRFEGQSFQQGRLLQHALYWHMAQEQLRKQTDADAKVTQVGYFFPSKQGKGARYVWSAEELMEAKGILDRLYRIVESGAFLATDKPEDCKYCEFNSVCRLPEDVEASQRKLMNVDNKVLLPMRELRHGK